MYFSRNTIPFNRSRKRGSRDFIYQHIGIYGFTVQALVDFFHMGGLGPSSLEAAEGLEQLRWLENGRKIRVGISHEPSVSVDTKKDLDFVIELIKNWIS